MKLERAIDNRDLAVDFRSSGKLDTDRPFEVTSVEFSRTVDRLAPGQ